MTPTNRISDYFQNLENALANYETERNELKKTSQFPSHLQGNENQEYFNQSIQNYELYRDSVIINDEYTPSGSIKNV